MCADVLRRDERGAVSVLGLGMLAAVLLLALGAVHFMRTSTIIAAEYERETQLRLAAESGIETAAVALEQSSEAYGEMPKSGWRKELSVGSVPVTGDIEVRVFVETRAGGQIYLIAAAVDHEKPHIDDGADWLRGKLVRAAMKKHEREERYVWQRFF